MNTIRELKQQEKYNNMLRRKNKEIERLCNALNEVIERNSKAIKLLKEAGCYDEETKTFCDDIWEELPNILSALEGSDKE